MDYKEKYEQALKRAKAYHNDYTKDIVEEIFPELKESEEENIRKELLDYCKSRAEKYPNDPKYKNISAWIAWLENQGVQEEDARWEVLKKLLEADSIYQMVMNDAMVDEAKSKAISAISKLSIFDLLKPIDKVEPKFHKGDWLCENEPNNYARFIQILEIVNVQGKERYRISRDIHNDEDIIEFDFVEKYYHKFDIKDAKDGDMLYLQHDGKEHIIIYKGVIKERFRTFVSAYCAYNGIVDAFCFADVSRYADIAYGGIMPATKEQRDLLFQKMKENGYEWDADKKELKKIDNHATWSEEDENNLTDTCVAIRKFYHNTNGAQELIDWLKLFKDKYMWKPSEIQLARLKEECDKHWEPDGLDTLYTLYQDLKKL